MLLPQIDKLVKETKRRQENGDYLTAGLKEIPGVQPVRLPENSRAVWHLYAFRYDAAQFNGLPRDKFCRALGAEGIPCGGGYHEQYYDGLLDEAITSRRLPAAVLRPAAEGLSRQLRGTERQQASLRDDRRDVQTLLLADRSDMDHILEAVRKIQAHSAALAKAA